jgi:hypothetical protein
MNERVFSSSHLLPDLLKFLQERCKMHAIKASPDGGFKFEAVLLGEDSLNIFVIEVTSNSNKATLKQIGRKVQSFAWSLQAQRKRNLVTLILVLPDVSSPEQIRRNLGGLNGSARVFLVSDTAKLAEIEISLNSLVPPAFALSQKESVGFAQVEKLLEGVNARPILDMAASSGSEIELTSKLTKRFESLAAEVGNATKKR